MPNFANIVITGHLGGDAEVSYTPDNTAVLRFSLAVNTGLGARRVCSWYRCVMFGNRGVNLQPHLTKGKAVTVAGEPAIVSFTNAHGTEKVSVDVRVDNLSFAGAAEPNSVPQTPTIKGMPETDDIPF